MFFLEVFFGQWQPFRGDIYIAVKEADDTQIVMQEKGWMETLYLVVLLQG